MNKFLTILLLAASVAMGFTVVHKTDSTFTCWDGVSRLIDVSYPDTNAQFPLLFIGHGFSDSKVVITEAVKLRFCNYGFVVAVISSRHDAIGMEVLDYDAAIKYVEAKYSSKLNGVRVYSGYSGGGGTGYALYSRCPDMFDLYAIHFGMNDFARWYTTAVQTNKDSLVRYIGGTPAQKPKQYAARNTINILSNNGRSKLFVMHDTLDPYVNIVEGNSWRDSMIAHGFNISYTRSNSSSSVRAIHGYPIISTAGAPNIEFERNAAPRWVDTAKVLNSRITMSAKGTFKTGCFIHTSKFSVVCNDSAIVNISYDTIKRTVTILNNVTSDSLKNAKFYFTGIAGKKYVLYKTINNVTTKSFKYLNSYNEAVDSFSVGANESVVYTYEQSDYFDVGTERFIKITTNPAKFSNTSDTFFYQVDLTNYINVVDSFADSTKHICVYKSDYSTLINKDVVYYKNKKCIVNFVASSSTTSSLNFYVCLGKNTNVANSDIYTNLHLANRWSFDKYNGTVFNDDVGVNNGTITSVDTSKFRIGTGALFNNTNDSVNCGAGTTVSNKQKLTFEFVYKPTDLSNNKIIYRIYKDATHKMYAYTDGTYFWFTVDGNATAYTNISNVVTANNTYLIHIVYDGSLATSVEKLKLFSNKVNKAYALSIAVPATTPDLSTVNLCIGSNVGGSIIGALDEFGIYNTAIDTVTIAKRYDMLMKDSLFTYESGNMLDWFNVKKSTGNNKTKIGIFSGFRRRW